MMVQILKLANKYFQVAIIDMLRDIKDNGGEKEQMLRAWCTVLSDGLHEQWKFQMMRKKKYLEYQVHLKSRKQYSADSTGQAQGEPQDGTSHSSFWRLK